MCECSQLKLLFQILLHFWRTPKSFEGVFVADVWQCANRQWGGERCVVRRHVHIWCSAFARLLNRHTQCVSLGGFCIYQTMLHIRNFIFCCRFVVVFYSKVLRNRLYLKQQTYIRNIVLVRNPKYICIWYRMCVGNLLSLWVYLIDITLVARQPTKEA